MASRLASWLVLAVVLAAPVTLVLQPFVPGLIQAGFLVARFILLPLALLVFRPREMDWLSFIALGMLVLATGFPGMAERTRFFWLGAGSLLGSVILFRAGLAVASDRRWDRIWVALANGVTVVNIMTLLALAGAIMGLFDPKTLLQLVQHDAVMGLDRFALGNAIEIPYVMCALLYAAIRCAPRGRTFPLAALLNLITAIISQSRLVVLMALLIFLGQWGGASRRWRWTYAVCLLVALYLFRDAVTTGLEPLLRRFGGQDYGSKEDRGFLVRTVFAGSGPFSLILGSGLTSSALLIQKVTGVYRTVENLVAEMLYELGFCGLLLIPTAMFRGGRKTCLRMPGFRPVVWLIVIEQLFFMPIFYTMPLVFFAMGVLSAPHAMRNAGERARALPA
jgi:hypothetical protein